MRNQTVSVTFLGTVLPLLLSGGAAHAQGIHVLRPAHNAVVRETVQVKVAPGDLPPGGYAAISIDGKFRTARALTGNHSAPVYTWDTKEGGSYATSDGAHTLQVDIFRDDGHLVGSDTIPVHIANVITNIPPGGVKLTYKWPAQQHAVYQRETSMKIAAADATPVMPGAADQVLQDSQLVFTRDALDPTASAGLIRDLVVTGTVTNNGQPQEILKSYNVQPDRRTVNARGVVLSVESADDYMDHIGFPVPELPNKSRVDKGDSWQAPVVVALNWDGSSAAHVTAECRLEGFEWQNNYPTAKIRETYTGPARFTSLPATASGHVGPPPISASNITFDRVLYFAYGAGRLVKSETTTKVTLTAEQLSSLGAAQSGVGPEGGPPGFQGGPPPGFQGGPPPGFRPPTIPNYGGGGLPPAFQDGDYSGLGGPVRLRDVQFGGPPPGFRPPSIPNYGGGPPPGFPGYQGGPPQGYPGYQGYPPADDQGQTPDGEQAAPQVVNTILTVTETTALQTP